MRFLTLFFSAFACACTLLAQTRVDLRTQGKGIDFADAPSTRPAKTGTVLPATCSTGELFFLTTAPAGENLYGCVGTNIWSLQSEMPLQSASGDASGLLDALTVTGIHGRSISSSQPANGEALVWNATAGQWQPSPASSGAVSSVAGKTGIVTLSTTDLADCKVTRVSAAVLTVAGCRAIFPNKAVVVLAPPLISATAGQGTAFIYVTPSGQFAVGHSGNLAISCAGCVDTGAMTSFPADVKRLWTYSTNDAATWSTDGGSDQRNLEPTLFEQGPGILITQASGMKTIAADTAILQTKPASQAGRELLCIGSTSTNATCGLTPMLGSYTTGMRLNYFARASNTTTMTLNVDSLGAKSVLKHDGSELAAGNVVAGRFYMLTYDGAAFRLPELGSSGSVVSSGGPAPRQVEFIGAKCQNGFAASGFSYGATGFPTASCVPGANGIDGVLQFTDTEPMTVYDRTTLPSSVSSISAHIWWRTAAVTGNVTWQLQTACVGALESGDPIWNTGNTVVGSSPGNANQWVSSIIPSLTLTGCAADEVLKFKLFRDPAHASDTIGATAELLSLVFTMTP